MHWQFNLTKLQREQGEGVYYPLQRRKKLNVTANWLPFNFAKARKYREHFFGYLPAKARSTRGREAKRVPKRKFSCLFEIKVDIFSVHVFHVRCRSDTWVQPISFHPEHSWKLVAHLLPPLVFPSSDCGLTHWIVLIRIDRRVALSNALTRRLLSSIPKSEFSYPNERGREREREMFPANVRWLMISLMEREVKCSLYCHHPSTIVRNERRRIQNEQN